MKNETSEEVDSDIDTAEGKTITKVQDRRQI